MSALQKDSITAFCTKGIMIQPKRSITSTALDDQVMGTCTLRPRWPRGGQALLPEKVRLLGELMRNPGTPEPRLRPPIQLASE